MFGAPGPAVAHRGVDLGLVRLRGVVDLCFHCYATNERPEGPCARCGNEIAAPPDAGYDDLLIWALRHPDGDRAIIAARPLGRRRSRAATPQLRSLVLDAPDPFLASEALRSLIAIEGVEELSAYLERLSRSGSFMITAVARAALREPGASARAPAG
jgi:hypothetical protein